MSRSPSKSQQNKKFQLTDHFVMTISAPRKSGKSYLIGNMLRIGMLDFDHIIVMCPTLEFNDDYLDFIDDENFTFINNITREDIQDLFKKQSACMRKVKQQERNGPGDDDLIICPDTLLILDDCIDSGVLTFKGIVDRIAERGRHINLSVIVSSQRISAISRSIRINSDYFLIFSPYSIGELEQFLEQFVSRPKRKELRLKLHDIFSEPYRFIFLDNTERRSTDKLKTSVTEDFIKGIVTPLVI